MAGRVHRLIIVLTPEHVQADPSGKKRGARAVIDIGRVVDGKLPILDGKVEGEIFFPLVRDETREIDAIDGDAGPDAEPIITGAGEIAFKDVASKIDTRGVQALSVINDLPFYRPFIGRLIMNNGEYL